MSAFAHYTSAWRSYRIAAAALARRHAGLARLAGDAAVPDWIDPLVVQSLCLPLPGGELVLGVAVRDGVPLSALPPSLRLPGASAALPLRRLRAAPACAQAVPGLRPASAPAMQGTATALLHDLRSNDRLLLTCGHVAAPDPQASVGQAIRIDHADASGDAVLRAWQPHLAEGAFRTSIDAALLRLDQDQFNALRLDASLLPAGLGAAPRAGQRVTLRRRSSPIDGRLLVYWSGPVDVPGLTPRVADYFLADAIGYQAALATAGGDSGAAVWDDQARLLGMHIAGLPDAAVGEANAVYGPIAPVLDWFKVQPWLRGGVAADPGLAGISPAPPRASAPQAGRSGLSALDIVAATIWGEARNQGLQGMRAVACVIANRSRQTYRGKQDAAAVCLDPWQFSCWNAADPNLPKLQRIAADPDGAYLAAVELAREVLPLGISDITDRARHYYAVTLKTPPYWARGKSPCKVIGDHLFFNDID